MGKVTQEFGEVLADLAGTGRLSEVVGEVFLTPDTSARLSTVMGEVFLTPDTSARLSTVMGEVFWPFLLPVAIVPDIRGIARLQSTFDSSASTGGYGDGTTLTSTKFWSWVAVPGGSTIANITPTPMPNSGGSSFISMTSNAVLYHCEGNGTDSSGNGNTATFSNTTTGAVGKVGTNAWSFDTNTGYAIMTNNVSLAGDYTIAFWFYDLGPDGNYRSAMNAAAGVFIPIMVEPGNLLGLWNGSFQTSGFSMPAASYTGWHHIVAVASGSSTLLYVDSLLVGTVATKLTQAQKYIGNQQGSNQRFALRMDEIAIFTRTLSASEVQALYVNQHGSYAGTGTTFPFTPDKAGTYTVQFALRDSLRPLNFPLVTDNANAEVVNADSSIWPSERLRIPAVQGRTLQPRRGQM